jgi:hypothetical protein
LNKILRRTLKILGWTVASIIVLLLLVIVLIQVPGVQNFARGKVVAFLEKKLGTKVQINHLSVAFPKKIVLEGVYFEDQQKDTLLAGRRLAVDIAMFQLLRSRVEINDIELSGIRANIYRKGADSFFNYDYIVKAFVAPETTPNPADTTGMKINIRHVALDKITTTFRDDASGADMYLYIGDFETKIKKFDLDHMVFDVPTLRLEGVVARVYQHKPLVEPKTVAQVKAEQAAPIDVGLTLGELRLKNIDADYGNDVSAIAANVKLGELRVIPEKIDLPNLQIALKDLILSNTAVAITLGATPPAQEVAEQAEAVAEAQAEKPWRITLGDVNFANNHIRFDNNASPRLQKGMDFAHLDVHDLSVDASDMAFTPTEYSGDISQVSFTEQSGFKLLRLQTAFLYDEHGVQLKDLLLETDKTILRDNIEIAWPNTTIANLANQPGEMLLRINLENSRIALRDVLTFMPAMANMPPFYRNEGAVFNIDTRIQGYVKDLEIENLEASGMSRTSLKLSGRIRGLPDPDRTVYNLNIANLSTSQADLAKLLPAGSIPPTVRMPETIAASGSFAGSMQAFNTKLTVRSSRGNADIIAAMRDMTSYNIAAGLGGLDLGYIMKQEQTFGRVSGQVTAVGSGFDPATMVATAKMKVFSAYVQGYNYRNLNLHAKLDRGNIKADAVMRDPNISFSVDATALMKGEFPALKMDMHLDSVNLQALGLYSSDLRIHGHVAADLASTNPDDLLGTVDISELIAYNAGKRYASSDTIHIAATREADGHHLALSSPALTADLRGQYKLTEIAQAVQHTLNRYYAIPGFREAPFAPQQWTLTAVLRPSPLLFSFAPEMQGSDSIRAAINYNSSAEDLKLAADAPRIIYAASRIDSLSVRAATGNTLNYALSLHSATYAQFRLHRTSLAGDVANNQVTAALDVKDPADRSRYQLGATLNQTAGNGFRIAMAPGLMLDYDTWNVTADNFIQYNDAGLIIHNFALSNGGQSIAAASTVDAPTAPIDLRFTNFNIGTITRIAEQDSLLVGGLINGSAQLRNPMQDLVFTSDIAISDLSYKQDTVGNLSIRVNNETDQTLAANIQLQGHGNDIRLDGRYFLATQKVDMDLDLVNVSLAAMKPFAGDQLQDAGGSLRGKLGVTGTIDKPNVDGLIRFDSAYITPTLLGERFALTDEAITVNATGIHFDNFTVADSANNTANIDGDLLTEDFKNYRFALDVTADNFQAVNSRRGVTHKPFYGRLNLSTNTRIHGDMNLPVVNSYVRINKNTDFSYVLPANDPEVQSRIGVVKFVDMSNPGDSSVFAYATDTVTHAGTKGLDVSATIETDSAAQFNIVIDERNGDVIHIRGTAALEAAVDRSGKVSLTGTYTMQDGSYLLTLNFLKRQFFIKPGSTITWDGDPTSATVDITAIYTANTAPIDLVQHQLAGRSQYEINQYKQRVPFNVLLNMKGELMKPQISFDIVLPEREANRLKDVDAKLAQVRADESEMNKQVFALLLLGHFVDENPLASDGTPTTAESFARQSASRILTDQLNRIAGNMIQGVELTFGVNSGSDYSSGDLAQRTDLTVGVSKKLLNDRLKVNVGSSFGIEGPTAPNQQASNIAGDVSLDYQLSKDGRYFVRAYRRNNYEGLVEGQVIETGATFIFRIDYDKFNEFFRRPRK